VPTIQSLEILAISKAWSHYCFRNRNALGVWHSPKGMPTFGWCLLLGHHPTCNTWQLICMVCALWTLLHWMSLGTSSLSSWHIKLNFPMFLGVSFESQMKGFKSKFFVPFYARSLSIVNQCEPMKQLEIWRMKMNWQIWWTNSLNFIRKYWWIIVVSLNDLACMKPTPENEMNFNGWLWYHNSTLVIRKVSI